MSNNEQSNKTMEKSLMCNKDLKELQCLLSEKQEAEELYRKMELLHALQQGKYSQAIEIAKELENKTNLLETNNVVQKLLSLEPKLEEISNYSSEEQEREQKSESEEGYESESEDEEDDDSEDDEDDQDSVNNTENSEEEQEYEQQHEEENNRSNNSNNNIEKNVDSIRVIRTHVEVDEQEVNNTSVKMNRLAVVRKHR